MLGTAGEWTTSDYLLANIVDLLAAANWQRSGGKRSARPTPIPRPGTRAGQDGKRIGTTAVPLDEMRRLADDWMAGRIAGRGRNELVKVR